MWKAHYHAVSFIINVPKSVVINFFTVHVHELNYYDNLGIIIYRSMTKENSRDMWYS